jgi:hypothetical protein
MADTMDESEDLKTIMVGYQDKKPTTRYKL